MTFKVPTRKFGDVTVVQLSENVWRPNIIETRSTCERCGAEWFGVVELWRKEPMTDEETERIVFCQNQSCKTHAQAVRIVQAALSRKTPAPIYPIAFEEHSS